MTHSDGRAAAAGRLEYNGTAGPPGRPEGSGDMVSRQDSAGPDTGRSHSSPPSVGVALLSPPGRSALAVVGVRGPGAARLADLRFRPRRGPPLAKRPAGGIAFGRWHETDTAAGEDLVVLCRDPDFLEVHCHGGTAAAEAVLRSLTAAGARPLTWPVWAEAGGTPAIEREALVALGQAGGPRAARILCRQASGMLVAALARLGTPAGEPTRLLRAARVGLRLATPWRVVVRGPVNAGKSSLVNALAGHARSIVSAEPGTTRDLVTTRLVMGGWEVELVDTAGDRDGALSETEHAGMTRAAEARATADLVLRVAVAGGPAPRAEPGELAVFTKADLTDDGPSGPDGLFTSAASGQGIDELATRIVAALVPEDRLEPGLLDGPVPFTLRQVDLIRPWA